MNGNPARSIFMDKGGRNTKGQHRRWPAAGPEIGGVSGSPSAVRRLRGISAGAAPQDHFHLILELELTLLQGDFLDLFGFRQRAGGHVMYLLVEVLVLAGELTILLIALQKLSLQLFEVCGHLRLL